MQCVPPEAQLRIIFINVEKTADCADALRQNGGDRRAAHAHAERAHERNVQQDIQRAAEQQQHKRRAAVAHRLQ